MFCSRLSLVFLSAFLLLTSGALQPSAHAKSSGGGITPGPMPVMVTITDDYHPEQSLPPGYIGPPGPAYDNITYTDVGVSSWALEFVVWRDNYVPVSSTDTTSRDFLLLDQGNGDNPGKTISGKRPDSTIADNFRRVTGLTYYCYHTYGFPLDGSPRADAYGPLHSTYVYAN